MGAAHNCEEKFLEKVLFLLTRSVHNKDYNRLMCFLVKN